MLAAFCVCEAAQRPGWAAPIQLTIERQVRDTATEHTHGTDRCHPLYSPWLKAGHEP